MNNYSLGGLERSPTNVLRLISELEGSYQLLKYMGFEDDMNLIETIKNRYYKIYFNSKQEVTSLGNV